MNTHTLSSMSPAQAAQAAGTSRWSVMRAINAGDLRAARDNHNAWRITPEDLDTWRSIRPAHGAAAAVPVGPAAGPAPAAQPGEAWRVEMEALRIGLAVATTRAEAAEARAAVAEVRIASAEADRDAWRVMVERQQALLENRRQAGEAPRPKGLLRRLLSR